MSFAIIETGGKQYRVADGDILTIEKLQEEYKEGDSVVFDKVLLFDDGKTTKIGTPYLEGATVETSFVVSGRAQKITVIRYKQKSRYFKKKGHRQPFMKVKIASDRKSTRLNSSHSRASRMPSSA